MGQVDGGIASSFMVHDTKVCQSPIRQSTHGQAPIISSLSIFVNTEQYVYKNFIVPDTKVFYSQSRHIAFTVTGTTVRKMQDLPLLTHHFCAA